MTAPFKIIDNVRAREAGDDCSRALGRRRSSRPAGEKRWTEAELAKVRKELEAEVAELRADISKAESEIAERTGRRGR